MAIAISTRPVLSDSLAARLPAGAAATIVVLLGTALTAACAQIAIYLPGKPVPITGQTFGVLLVGAALGPARAVASMGMYLLLSIAGLPLLAPSKDGSHVTGSAVLHLPTLGYLIGFIFAGAALGAAARRGLDRKPWWTALSFLVGSAIIYLFGAVWLGTQLHLSVATAYNLGVGPFLFGDLLKALLAGAVLPAAWWLTNRLDG